MTLTHALSSMHLHRLSCLLTVYFHGSLSRSRVVNPFLPRILALSVSSLVPQPVALELHLISCVPCLCFLPLPPGQKFFRDRANHCSLPAQSGCSVSTGDHLFWLGLPRGTIATQKEMACQVRVEHSFSHSIHVWGLQPLSTIS